MTSPNADATPQSVADDLAGINGDGTQRPYRRVASFYPAHMFGRNKDYAFPVGAEVATATQDHAVNLAKLLTRTRVMDDKNEYDALDCLWTITKYILSVNPHINDDEVNSVNHKAAQ